MILLTPDQLPEFVAFAQSRGENVVIVATADGIEAYMVPPDGAQSLRQAANAWAAR